MIKKRSFWKVMLVLGFCPFIFPFVLGFYHTIIESWTLLDWLILYSFIFWPTYLIGLIVIIVSAIFIGKTK